MTLTRIALATAVCLVATAYSSAPRAQMHKCQAKDGRVVYQEHPCAREAKASTVRGPAPSPAGTSQGSPAEARKGGATQASFLPEEQTALKQICSMMLLQLFTCRTDLKRFCPLDELVAGIGGNPNKGLTEDPRRNPDYEFRVVPRGELSTVTANPRRPGLHGFLNEGDGTRYNPKGPARSNDPKVDGGLNCAGWSK